MQAILYTKYGPPDVLQLKEVAKPTPRDDTCPTCWASAGEVLIKVHAVSINRSDWEGLSGKPWYARIGGLLKPHHQILGSDIAGRVEIDRWYPLSEVPEALRYLGEGRAKGKVVIAVEQNNKA